MVKILDYGSGQVGGLLLGLGMALGAATACSGSISLSEPDRGGESPAIDHPSGSGGRIDPITGLPIGPSGDPVSPLGEGNPEGDPNAPIAPAPSTRAARLTHAQWENSVRDLFGLEGATSFSSLLRSDPVQKGFMFDNDGSTMAVDDALWGGYEQAAADVAEFVVSDATRLEAIAPAAGNPSERAARLIAELGLRAHRRPLTPEEAGEYSALFAMASALYTDLSGFEAGARLLIEAMLQSPHFLYRIETSATATGGVIPLGSYEVASRLSYTLWNTMPDAALFEAAASDRLRDPAEVSAQALRMLDDPRAERVVAHFHDQLFEVERYAGIRPSAALHPDVSAAFGEHAANESRHFVREIVFGQRGNYADLLTSSETFVNDELAAVYGVQGDFGSEFEKVQLDPAERQGLFTQIGFLALNATSANPDPIHRGVFLARRIDCTELAAPPANIPPLPAAQGRTNRETVQAHTEAPGSQCAMCHASIINPLGFPFENFDAIGRHRTTDNGHPIDTSSDAWTGSMRVAVRDGVELTQALARSRAVHDCYARHWLEFAYGRPRAAHDASLIAALGARSLNEGLSIPDLVVALVTTPAFLNRSTQELP
jgi:hypothetical protein